MKNEVRVIKASFAAGLTDIAVGLIMAITGWQQWYYEHFHFFGVIGFSLVAYAYWHRFYYLRETEDKHDGSKTTSRK